jgi:hypothetical protein
MKFTKKHITIQSVNHDCQLLQDEHLRCSLSPESQIEDSGTEASTDDGNLDAKGNGFHDAENDVDQEMEDDNGVERILSGKLSESSGYADSDLYDYKVLSCVLPDFLLTLMFAGITIGLLL